jgi:hypothetical protein
MAIIAHHRLPKVSPLNTEVPSVELRQIEIANFSGMRMKARRKKSFADSWVEIALNGAGRDTGNNPFHARAKPSALTA